jgi:hypothetical protein
MYTSHLHLDFKDESVRAGWLSGRMSTTISLVGSFLEKNWGAIKYFFLILPIALIVAIISIPTLGLTWLAFRWVNNGLRKSLQREMKYILDTELAYIESKHRIIEIRQSLAKIEELDSRIDSSSIFFKPLFKRELCKSRSTILKYISDAESHMAEINQPVLKSFGAYTVSESKLWESRPTAYEYLF